jgi:broad specificity polyphosphatase/5'/3'-nucleotidase SurE
MALTEVQLAGLDLLIAQKKAQPEFITDVANDVANVANAVVAVTAAAAAVAAVVAAAAAVALSDAERKQKFAKGISLEELLKIRTKALESR